MRVERAVILAAGLGTRLKWLTRDRPKALIEVAGTPVIVHVIRELAAQGIRDIAVNVHHHAEKLVRALGDGSRFGVRLYYSREETLLDSGGGMRTAMQLLPGHGLLAVHNADVLADIDVQTLARACPEAGACLALVSNPAHHPAGDFALRHGLLVPDSEPRYTFAGVSVWEQNALDARLPGQVFPLVDTIQALADEHRCSGMLHGGFWFDIGRPCDLMLARRRVHAHEQ
jgi:Nucleoside-diphosphate-sugar pyrophosphorylase involved in lipopolysaccharide biosynthesis/translation initiation factor 2B, gamma/epsilon subunits (eIF-2Bgamma/eIF-2Bepsilon)